MENRDIICCVLAFLTYIDIFEGLLFQVCKSWSAIIRDCNQILPLLDNSKDNHNWYEYGPSMYKHVLRHTLTIPSRETAKKINFYCDKSKYSHYIDTFIQTYRKNIWKNIPTPTLIDLNNHITMKNKNKTYSDILWSSALMGNKFAFSHIFSLLEKNYVKYKSDNETFDLICESCKKFGIKFIMWILRERPLFPLWGNRARFACQIQ
jgi:hypothetical protein